MRLLTFLLISGCLWDDTGSDAPGSSDLEGAYEVASWRAQEDGCTGPGAAAEPPYAYFEVAVDDFFGVEALALYACSSLGNCASGLSTETMYFDSWDDDTAQGQLLSASHDAGLCSLTWIDGVLSGTPEGATFESLTYQEEVTGLDLQDCIDQQDGWSAERTCVRLDVVDGIRL